MTTKTATKFTKAQQNIIDTLANDSALYVDRFQWNSAHKCSFTLRANDDDALGVHVRDLNVTMVKKLIDAGALVKDSTPTANRHTRYVLAADYMQGEER